MSTQVDEETPLLRSQHIQKTPLPWFQLSIVLVLQLAEPLTSQVIYPFAPQLIRDLGITNGNESKIGYYVGLMQSIFFLVQAMTVLHWNRVSDSVGRKPVILTGLVGLSLSMYCFGLSRTFLGLLLRWKRWSDEKVFFATQGIVMMAEMTDATNISQAYAYMPIAWSTGGTLGPIIGGSLSRPAEQFPRLFGNSEFLKKYPYFLPCAVSATFSALAGVVTLVFLKETVASPVPLSQFLKLRKGKTDPPTLPDTQCPQEPTSSSIPAGQNDAAITGKPLPLRLLLTPRVVIVVGNYVLLSLVDIAFRAIQPLFLSTPIELGGLGLPPPIIGNVLSIFGILNGVFIIFFFMRIHDRWGSKKVFTAGIASAFPLFISFPIINHVAKSQGLSHAVWLLVGVQIVISVCLSLSSGAIFIFISAASPNRASLGATYGLSQMSVSIMRAIGPAATTSMFSLSMEKNYLGGYLVYYVLVLVTGVAMFVASMLPKLS